MLDDFRSLSGISNTVSIPNLPRRLAVLDLVRRLMLSSLLMALDKSYQILTALSISMVFLVLHRETL